VDKCPVQKKRIAHTKRDAVVVCRNFAAVLGGQRTVMFSDLLSVRRAQNQTRPRVPHISSEPPSSIPSFPARRHGSRGHHLRASTSTLPPPPASQCARSPSSAAAASGRLDPRPRLRRRSRHRGRLRLPRRRRPVRRCRAGGFVRRAGSVPPGPRARRGRGVQAGVHGRRFCPRRGTAVRVPRQVRAGDHGGATLRAPRRGRRRARSCHGEGVPHQQDHTARRRPDRARLCRRDGDQVSSRFSTECSVVCTCWNRTYRIFAASR
jgi:hypothetical protein